MMDARFSGSPYISEDGPAGEAQKEGFADRFTAFIEGQSNPPWLLGRPSEGLLAALNCRTVDYCDEQFGDCQVAYKSVGSGRKISLIIYGIRLVDL